MTRSVRYNSSPLLASKTPVWRSKLIVAAIALGFAGLAGRSAWVQVFGNTFFQRQGEVRFARTLELPASRGRILDRNGLLLATSVPAPSIWAIPEDVEHDRAKLSQLAKLLEMPLADLEKKLENEDKTFVWLKRQLDEPVARQIEALGMKGIYQRKEYKRQYPEAEAAAHVVGFTNVEDRGQEGMELAFEKSLAGRVGSRRVIKDRLGRVVEDVGELVRPVDGKDLQLSIDSKVQFFAYQKLRDAVLENKAKAGSVVVLDVATGEVLALANYPSYSPAKRQNLSGAQLRNRALTDTFEPGSTMKPFVVALALQKGLVRPETTIQTAPGRLMIGGSTISDSHPHGLLSVNQVIQKSSNVGTVKMAMQMQPREMWELYSQVGFGAKPQVPFPGAVGGRLRAYKTWKPIEQATMSYGYGLSTSLFQLARAYTVFAHDGELVNVTMLKRESERSAGPPQASSASSGGSAVHAVTSVEATGPSAGPPRASSASPGGSAVRAVTSVEAPRPSGIRVLDAGHALAVRNMLHMAAGAGGTAPKAQTTGYSVGGKTGTAHKQEGKGYADKKYRGFFVGMAPVENPRIVVAVMIDEPGAGKYFGGDVAAPVFSATVQQTLRMLGVQPDMSVVPQIVVAVEESF